jgi:hypothetical protein
MAKEIEPVDLERCQADIRPAHSFMTLGPRPPWERCKNKPTVIIKEVKPGEDDLKGSMSLCSDCFAQFCMRVCPTSETHEFEEIK